MKRILPLLAVLLLLPACSLCGGQDSVVDFCEQTSDCPFCPVVVATLDRPAE